MRWISNFIELTRMYALTVTLASCLIIFSFANYSENYTFFNFILMTFALLCVHLGANLFDDFIDVKKKLKETNDITKVYFDGFFQKARLITNKTYSINQVKTIISILFLIPSLIGIYFILNSGFEIIFFMLLGGLLTLFYPISSKYCLAEITIGLIYGPLIINGGYFALTKEFNSSLFLLSIAIFFSCLVLLQTHNIMDYEFDEKNGKKTICILLKSKEKAIKVLKAFITIPYLIILFGVLTQSFNPNILYVFLTLPIATELIKSIKDYVNIKDVKFIPRWYYGAFENWEEIKKEKLDFFMYRFYLARNFGFFFAIFACIGSMI